MGHIAVEGRIIAAEGYFYFNAKHLHGNVTGHKIVITTVKYYDETGKNKIKRLEV